MLYRVCEQYHNEAAKCVSARPILSNLKCKGTKKIFPEEEKYVYYVALKKKERKKKGG